MGGGEIQLHRYGAQNIYLNGNPQIKELNEIRTLQAFFLFYFS